MRITKRFLSVAMALIMLCSMCVVPSFAANEPYPNGTEDASKINIKFGVEQVSEIYWDAYDLTLNAVDNNIYAVTIYAKAAYGINTLQVPVHFDKTLFSPLMWADDAPIENGSLGYDGFYTDNSSQDVYDFYAGEAMEDTTMLRANGNTAPNKGAAAYIPMGNTNYGVMNNDVRYVDNSNPAVNAWVAGLSANTGVMYRFYLNMTAKMAYLNVKNNAVVTDWCNVGTIYFIRNEGVSEADAVGAEFGFTAANSYGSQGLLDTSGETKYNTTTYAESEPGLHYVANAFVEEKAVPSIVNPLKGQMRYDSTDSKYDVRALAVITAADFNATFTDEATAKGMIKEVGFVFAAGSNVSSPNMAGVKALVENGTALAGYEKKTVSYISTGISAGNYVFSCIVKNISDADAQTNSLVAVGYIAYEVEGVMTYAYYPAAQTITFSTLYNSNNNPNKA